MIRRYPYALPVRLVPARKRPKKNRVFRVMSNCGIGPVKIRAKSYVEAVSKLVEQDGKALPFLGRPMRITIYGRRVDWNENVLFLNPL